MKKVQNIIHRVEEFPTLPTIYSTLSDVMSNARSTASDVADVIAKDQASASKVLRAANSSIYGFRGRINTITQAIVYIGFEEVKNLVLALAIIDMFKKDAESDSFNPVNLWKHSLAVGSITRIIGSTVGVKNLENYYISGILHDIGKLLFFKYFPKEYNDVINLSIEKKVSIRAAEAEILGITHTVTGELLAEKWKLPVSIRDAITNHYSGKVGNKPSLLVSSVHIANIASVMFEYGNSGDEFVPKPNPEIWDFLKLPDQFFTQALPKIQKDYYESVQLLLHN